MFLGIRKDLIIVTLTYIDRPLGNHILISFLIESGRSIKFFSLSNFWVVSKIYTAVVSSTNCKSLVSSVPIVIPVIVSFCLIAIANVSTAVINM